MIKSSLISKLRKIKGSGLVADALANGTNQITVVSERDMLGVKKIKFSKGFGPQNIGGNVDTTFDAYFRDEIRKKIEEGKIDDGTKTPFDDRKVRLSSRHVLPNYTKSGESISFEAGPTDYQRYKQDMERSAEEAIALMLRGAREGNFWKYFACPIGVAVFPITKEGHTYVGVRQGVDLSGFLCSVAGHMTFSEDLKRIDPYKDAQHELKEESGVDMKLDENNTSLIGMSQDAKIGDANFVFLVQTGVPTSYFESGEWRKHAKEREHGDLILIKDANQAREALGSRKPLIHSTKLGLEYLAKRL